MHQLDLRRLRIPRQRALELAFAGVWFGGIFLGLLASGGYGGMLGDLARSAGISPPEFRVQEINQSLSREARRGRR